MLQARYLRSLLAAAREAFRQGDLARTARYCMAYVKQDPLEEDAVVLLEGEAGVGKTYLLDHILARYDFSDWLICRSFCCQTEANSFLVPWNSVMLELAAELELRHITIPETYIKTAAGADLRLCGSGPLRCPGGDPSQGYLGADLSLPPTNPQKAAG